MLKENMKGRILKKHVSFELCFTVVETIIIWIIIVLLLFNFFPESININVLVFYAWMHLFLLFIDILTSVPVCWIGCTGMMSSRCSASSGDLLPLFKWASSLPLLALMLLPWDVFGQLVFWCSSLWTSWPHDFSIQSGNQPVEIPAEQWGKVLVPFKTLSRNQDWKKNCD